MPTITVTLNLSDEIYHRLQEEAKRRNITIDELVSIIVSEYFDKISDVEN